MAARRSRERRNEEGKMGVVNEKEEEALEEEKEDGEEEAVSGERCGVCRLCS
jgi:hypothetical protein